MKRLRENDLKNKGEPDGRNRQVLPFLLLLKKQHVFHLSSAFDARYHLAPVTPEGNILPVDVPVSGFQLLQQPAFGHLPVPLEAVSPHIVGQYADEQLSKPQHYPKNIVFYSVNHSVIG